MSTDKSKSLPVAAFHKKKEKKKKKVFEGKHYWEQTRGSSISKAWHEVWGSLFCVEEEQITSELVSVDVFTTHLPRATSCSLYRGLYHSMPLNSLLSSAVFLLLHGLPETNPFLRCQTELILWAVPSHLCHRFFMRSPRKPLLLARVVSDQLAFLFLNFIFFYTFFLENSLSLHYMSLYCHPSFSTELCFIEKL